MAVNMSRENGLGPVTIRQLGRRMEALCQRCEEYYRVRSTRAAENSGFICPACRDAPPMRFKFRARSGPAHVQVTVFAAPE